MEYIRLLQQPSREEPGSLTYVGHHSTENPRKFLIYEQYKDQAALDAHRNAPYFKQYVHGGLDGIMDSLHPGVVQADLTDCFHATRQAVFAKDWAENSLRLVMYASLKSCSAA